MYLGNDGRHLRRAESFETQERQIQLKGRVEEWVQRRKCRYSCALPSGKGNGNWSPSRNPAASMRHLLCPRMSHFITMTSIHLSFYKKKDALPCRSPRFSAKRGGHGPAAALTHLLCIWPGQKLLHPPYVLLCLEYRFNPWRHPAIRWLGTIKAMVLFT